MKKIKLVVSLCIGASFFSSWAQAGQCYLISLSPYSWSRTPHLLCVEKKGGTENSYRLELLKGLEPKETVAVFHYELMARSRCLDCNGDQFGLINESNSDFNSLTIRFNGRRDPRSHIESGTVDIGMNRFHYRSMESRSSEPVME